MLRYRMSYIVDFKRWYSRHRVMLLQMKVNKNGMIFLLITRLFNAWDIHWPKMKTLHFISLNNCFVSIHVVVWLTHAYRDFVADNDYAIFIQVPGLFKCQRLETGSLRCTCRGTGGSFTAFKPTRKHLQLSTGYKKIIYCFKALPFHLSKDQRNHVIDLLMAGLR